MFIHIYIYIYLYYIEKQRKFQPVHYDAVHSAFFFVCTSFIHAARGHARLMMARARAAKIL